MELIEDLGLRPSGIQGNKARWGLYKCPECGELFERATATIEYDKRKGGGKICRSCSNRIKVKNSLAARTKTLEQFIIDAIKVHGDIYSYILVHYINNHTKVKITCPTHGAFEQKPNDHLMGHGCPYCAKERNNIAMRMSEKNDRPTTLYYIYFPEVNLWKVGCTTQTLAKRLKEEKLQYTVLRTKEYTSGNEAYRVEKFILDFTKATQYKGTVLLKGGDSELRMQPIENFESLLQAAEEVL